MLLSHGGTFATAASIQALVGAVPAITAVRIYRFQRFGGNDTAPLQSGVSCVLDKAQHLLHNLISLSYSDSV